MPKTLLEALDQTVLSKGIPADQIKSLELDGACLAKEIEGLEPFSSLEVLSLSGVGLRSLKGITSAPSTLIKLSLMDNQISGGLEVLRPLTNLQILELGGNRITKLEDLEPLKQMPKLRSLDVDRCPIEISTPNLREFVFKLMCDVPTFVAFNGDNVDGEPVDVESDDGEDDEEGGEEEYEEEGEGGGGDDEGEEEGGEEEEGGATGAGAGAGAGGDDEEEEEFEEEEEEEEDEDEEEENEEEGEEFPTAELLKEQLSDDEGEYEEPATKKARKAGGESESEFEEDDESEYEDDEDDSDYEEDD